MPARATTNLKTLLAVVVCCAGGLNAAIAGWALFNRPTLNTDFMAFWSFPRFAAAHGAAGIYDAGALQAFQQSLYPGFHSFYPYLYPPTLLTVTGWLGHLGFAAAQAVWTIAGLTALIAAGWAFFPARWRAFGIFAMLASPASLLNFMTGETAYFTTALLLTGFAALPRRKLLAGLAFGLLTLKPQLGVLVPVFLLAQGEWRAILAAAATALSLIAWSCVAFTPSLWLTWAHTLPAYQAAYFAAGASLNLNIIVTIAANLITLGVAGGTAWAAQLVGAAVVGATVFFTARRAPYRLAMAALFTGIFLTAPHAYAYDSIILTPALLLLAESGVSWPFAAIALIIFTGPLLLLTPASHWFLYAAPEAILFATIISRCLAPLAKTFVDEPGARPKHTLR
jgi:hypothetical protein